MTDRRTDAELLADHRRSDGAGGDDRPFAELVRRNVGWVHGAARRRLRDTHLADDVAQAVFILLHRKAPTFQTDRALVAWLHRTTWYASEVADRQRRRQRHHETEAAMLRSQMDSSSSHEPDPQWQELAPLLDQLIERLGRRDREAVLLRFYRQMTFAQVAAATETTEEAARKRVNRALDKLRAWASGKGVNVPAAALAAGMEGAVACAAPVGIVSAATGAALAARGSAVTASSIPIAKGAITMMAWAKAKLVAGVALAALITTAGGVALIAATGGGGATSSPSSPRLRPPAPRELAAAPAASQPQRGDYPKLSPYDAIRWKDDDTPEIHVAGTWYGWLAIDDVDVAKIIEFTRDRYKPREVRMRIGEDLVEVLTRMGNPPGPTVKLKVRKLDTGETIDLKDVPMTHENRQKVFKARIESERGR
jgi:RNA polymerase sigma factor (sigma-70 family)